MRVKADKAVFTVTGTTLLTFFIASRIGTIWILYPNVLIAIVLFVYCIRQTNQDVSLLSSSSVFGLVTALMYVPMDRLFSRKARMIFYLRADLPADLTTPIGLILNWVVFVTLTAYCYQRFSMIFRAHFGSESSNPRLGFIGTAMLAAGITGIVAAVGSTVIYAFGASYLWVWNATQIDLIPQIASVPVFVPVSFLLTFLLCPYFFGVDGSFLRKQHVGVAGIRCGIFMGALQFLSFLLFYVWK